MDLSQTFPQTWRTGPKALPMDQPQSLQDVVRLIQAEREARETALAEAQKHMDWRLVHLAEDFHQRLSTMEKRMEKSGAQGRSALEHSTDSVRLMLGSLDRSASAKGDKRQPQATEVPRLERLEALEALEALGRRSAEHAHELTQRRVEEAEVWLGRMEGRLSELEGWLAEHRYGRKSAELEDSLAARRTTASRLAAVERLTLEAPPTELKGFVASHGTSPFHNAVGTSLPRSSGSTKPALGWGAGSNGSPLGSAGTTRSWHTTQAPTSSPSSFGSDLAATP